MAYRLKRVSYQGTDRNILLQNENGPCPLLAAANALLLKGVISLPAECVRTGVASIDDVVNILAERALKQEATNGEHYLHELLQIFPNLQYGMDVNPKFTSGPTGVEYTSNLTAFDLMNVDLVHGWLLDPQDAETHQLIGKKSYNELVEIVIRGQEASSEAEAVAKEIQEKQTILDKKKSDSTRPESKQDGQENNIPPPAASPESSWVNVSANEDEKVQEVATGAVLVEASSPDNNNETEVQENDAVLSDLLDESKATSETPGDAPTTETAPPESSDEITTAQDDHNEDMAKDPIKLEAELSVLRQNLNNLSVISAEGTLINTFLSSSSHQLTHFGLHELYEYLAEESLTVFFRNNHFATLTKHEGLLYLLVTDLGYANVPEVMWEKLDGIDGDTEYVNCLFRKPAAQAELLPGAAVPNPEQMLTQRGQSEADYQLALQLSRHSGDDVPHQQLDEQEGKLMAAATAASLRSFNGVADEAETQNSNTPTVADIPHVGVPLTSTPVAGSEHSSSAMEDQDRVIAMQLQAQMEREDVSAQLARELQEQENQRANQQRATSSRNRTNNTRATASSSSCIIS